MDSKALCFQEINLLGTKRLVFTKRLVGLSYKTMGHYTMTGYTLNMDDLRKNWLFGSTFEKWTQVRLFCREISIGMPK